jgi:hypothetical protein
VVKVEVTADPVEEFKGESKKTGAPFHIRRQAIFVDVGDKYPAKTMIQLEREQAPYAAGMYTFGPKSFFIGGQYGELQFARRIELVPLQSQRASS